MNSCGKRKRAAKKFYDDDESNDTDDADQLKKCVEIGEAAKTERKREPKMNWTPEEDALLTSGVEKFGSSGAAWSNIAKLFDGTRDAKRCRERWIEYIDPKISHDPFTSDEDQVLLSMQNHLGNQWKEIAVLLASKFPQRSSTGIKSRWHQLKKRNSKHRRSDEVAAIIDELLHQYDEQILKLQAHQSDKIAQAKADAAAASLLAISLSKPKPTITLEMDPPCITADQYPPIHIPWQYMHPQHYNAYDTHWNMAQYYTAQNYFPYQSLLPLPNGQSQANSQQVPFHNRVTQTTYGQHDMYAEFTSQTSAKSME